MTTPATSMSGLDLAPLLQDAISRGYIQPYWSPLCHQISGLMLHIADEPGTLGVHM